MRFNVICTIEAVWPEGGLAAKLVEEIMNGACAVAFA